MPALALGVNARAEMDFLGVLLVGIGATALAVARRSKLAAGKAVPEQVLRRVEGVEVAGVAQVDEAQRGSSDKHQGDNNDYGGEGTSQQHHPADQRPQAA